MSGQATRESEVWLRHAQSDVRTAEAMFSMPSPMQPGDVGCHLAALCAQAIEKSLKGYMLLNGATPTMNHRPDKYLPILLMRDEPLLRYKEHHGHLSKLFDPQTKGQFGGCST